MGRPWKFTLLLIFCAGSAVYFYPRENIDSLEGSAELTQTEKFGHASPGQSPLSGSVLQQSPNTPQLLNLRTQSAELARQLNSAAGTEVERLKQVLNLGSKHHFESLTRNTDRKGNQHQRYRQTYRDIPLWGHHLLVHQGAAADYYRVDGKLAKNLDTAQFNQLIDRVDRSESALQNALKIVKQHHQHNDRLWHYASEESELTLYFDEQGQVIPVYAVSYFASQRDNSTLVSSSARHRTVSSMLAPTRPHALIQALSGEVLKAWEGFATAEVHGPGGNEKTGLHEYGSDYPALEVSTAGGRCIYENGKAKVVDLNHRAHLLFNQAYGFDCTPEQISRNTHKAINGAYSPLNDAVFYSSVAYDMFDQWFQEEPLPFKINLKVHFGQYFSVAGWSGMEVVIGDGGVDFYPYMDLEVVAHEIAHGVTDSHSNLIYSGQSGGLNEAFSDIVATATEFFLKGEVDWLVGDSIVRTGLIRSFSDPSLDGNSIAHTKDYYEDLDVHYSSGIFNHAFYLLANTPGWDIRSALELFYEANKTRWQPSTGFNEGACGVLDVAFDLGGDFSRDLQSIIDAFDAVGVHCDTFSVSDADGDGMEDSWERRFGLNPALADGDAHADGDCLTNLEEFRARTNPTITDSDGDLLSDWHELGSENNGQVCKGMSDDSGLAALRNLGTNPNLADSDFDGLSDYDEILKHETDPLLKDSDADGMDDGWEIQFALTPLDAADADDDADGDGVSNLQEYENGANPTNKHSDNDGLDDGMEILDHGTDPVDEDSDNDGRSDAEELDINEESGFVTNPNNRDTDGDLLSDGWEIQAGTDPLNADTDGDGLIDGGEIEVLLTDPLLEDTDADGMPDGWELEYFSLDPLVDDALDDLDSDRLANVLEYEIGSNPTEYDTDGDGLNDGREYEISTDPTLEDTDADGMPDGWEYRYRVTNPLVDDALADPDQDGLTNIAEFESGTDPGDSDTDDDSKLDGEDIAPLLRDQDGDGAISAFALNCDQACREATGFILDQFPDNAAASVDLDLDGFPDQWNSDCDLACQQASGLELDRFLNDEDNDGIPDLEDINTFGLLKTADIDSDGLIEIADIDELNAVRFSLAGNEQRFGPDGEGDISGCPVVVYKGVLQRICEGYELVADIDFDTSGDGLLDANDRYWNEAAGWEPVGSSIPFTAKFRGNGYRIKNMMINRPDEYRVGLFGNITGASIAELNMSGPLMSIIGGRYSTGAIAGFVVDSEISACQVNGYVKGEDDTGGLVGEIYGISRITASLYSGRVEGPKSGGLAGVITAPGVIEGSLVIARVSGSETGALFAEDYNSQPDAKENNYWAVEYSGQQDGAGPVSTLAELRCPVAANDSACVPIPLYLDWQTYVDDKGDPYWDFGDSTQLPALSVKGKVYRDSDGDGALDADDVFPSDSTEAYDSDADGVGNNADPDDDGDGVPDVDDGFPLDPTKSLDNDRDGIDDNTDTDNDNDGVDNTQDQYPLDVTRWQNRPDLLVSTDTLDKWSSSLSQPELDTEEVRFGRASLYAEGDVNPELNSEKIEYFRRDFSENSSNAKGYRYLKFWFYQDDPEEKDRMQVQLQRPDRERDHLCFYRLKNDAEVGWQYMVLDLTQDFAIRDCVDADSSDLVGVESILFWQYLRQGRVIARIDDIRFSDNPDMAPAMEDGFDADGDGVIDSEDAFPEDGTEWADKNNNGIGDNVVYNSVGATIDSELFSWSTGVIDISRAGSTGVNVSMLVEGKGSLDPSGSDFLYIYYVLDRGPLKFITRYTGNFSADTIDLSVNGKTLEIILEGATSGGNKAYIVSNISVKVEDGDKDKDGVADNQDQYPQDATRWQDCPRSLVAYEEGSPPEQFITQWQTNKSGISADNQITLHVAPNFHYDYSVDWGDGSSDVHVSTEITHTYTAPGNYDVRITGLFPQTYFPISSDPENPLSDAQKLIFVKQWGEGQWSSMHQAFAGSDVKFIASDVPDLSQVTDLSYMFATSSKFNSSIDCWNVSKVENFSGMFSSAYEFNQQIGRWNVSNATDMSEMFFSAEKFNGDIRRWSVANVTDMNAMFIDSGLSQKHYDALLNHWGRLPNLQTGVELDVSAGYSFEGAFGRSRLTDEFGWAIFDDGAVNSAVDSAPALQDAEAQTFSVFDFVSIRFENDGGGEVTNCTITPSLPRGLLVSRAGDRLSCVISGFVSEAIGASSFTVEASNTYGSSQATVGLTVLSEQ